MMKIYAALLPLHFVPPMNEATSFPLLLLLFFPRKYENNSLFSFLMLTKFTPFFRERKKKYTRCINRTETFGARWKRREKTKLFHIDARIFRRFLFSTGTVFPARWESTSMYVATWLAKQRVYKHRWHRSPLRGVLLLIEKRCPAPNVTTFLLPPSPIDHADNCFLHRSIDRHAFHLIARWSLRVKNSSSWFP